MRPSALNYVSMKPALVLGALALYFLPLGARAEGVRELCAVSVHRQSEVDSVSFALSTLQSDTCTMNIPLPSPTGPPDAPVCPVTGP